MSEKKTERVVLRNPSGDDLNFILDSWLRSARGVGDNAHMNNAVYYGEAGYGFRDECVKKLKGGFVTVACNPSDQDQIIGWMAWGPGVLHYIYVKQPFRQMGIATKLVTYGFPAFGSSPTVTSSIGRFQREWAKKYNLVFDPYSWTK